jgi:riboflavin transporter FmnP
VLISLTTSGFSWIYWLILSFLLVLGIRHLYPAAPYLPVEFSNSNLPGLMAIMPLALLGAAAAALLQGIPSHIRSEKNED